MTETAETPETPPATTATKAKPRRRTTYIIVAVAAVGALAAVAVAALLINITNRKHEGQNPYVRLVEVTEATVDPAIWGKNFPAQYDGYKRTVDQERTRYGGSEAVQRTPTKADPRSIVAQSRLEEDPRLKVIWEGYAFSKDFREERGHAFMLADQEFTERQQVTKQPGTCLHCHASIYNVYKTAGNGDLMAGFEKVNQLPFAEARKLVQHPISCIDCHDPKTMELRVTRPGFLEGIRAAKAKAGIANYDVNRDASHQEMRSFVCGQCHVEYYFKGPEKRLTYPWINGLTVDAIYTYYTEVQQTDWTNPRTGTKLLKAQHPEFEMYNQGIHARSGVACADCHMPYMRVGAAKISDHQVRSPLLNINRACQTCHKFPEDEMRARVYANQDRTFALRNRAMDAVVGLIEDLARARSEGRGDDQLATARELHRQAQFYLDFVEAENSVGFHAPGEAARILAISIDLARQGQLALRGTPPVVPADRVVPAPAAPAGDATNKAPGSNAAPGPGSGSATK